MKKRIKIMVMDVDGTLTDGKIYMGNKGEVCKAFHVKDGYGIHHILPGAGITPAIITGRSSKILEQRCEELGIDLLYQKVSDKMEKLCFLLEKEQVGWNEVAYIGDDLNDYTCMREVKKYGGITGCPADASAEILALSDFVSQKCGGDGAVREFIECLVKTNYKKQERKRKKELPAKSNS